MKKLLVIAAFGVAGLASASSAVEKRNDTKSAAVAIQLFGVTVTFFDSSGNPTGQRMYTSDQPSYAACQSYQDGVIANLQSQGYRVTKLTAGIEPTNP